MEHWECLPFKAYPGTLNVKVHRSQVKKILSYAHLYTYVDGVKAPYRMGTLNGIEVAVCGSGVAPHQVELVAAVRLRDIPLSDGNLVTIILDDPVKKS
jgi:CTP-dependent riboflavin kinase